MEHKKDITPGQNAYVAFEMDYFANAMAIGNLLHGKFDIELIRQIVQSLEESTFEAIEAGCFSELDGLTQLCKELEGDRSALRHYRIDDLACEVETRIDAIRARIDVLMVEEPYLVFDHSSAL